MAFDTLDELKAAVAAHREAGKKIINHFKRLESEYSDWEDRLIEIEAAIEEAEEITGLKKEEIIKPAEHIFDDLLS